MSIQDLEAKITGLKQKIAYRKSLDGSPAFIPLVFSAAAGCYQPDLSGRSKDTQSLASFGGRGPGFVEAFEAQLNQLQIELVNSRIATNKYSAAAVLDAMGDTTYGSSL